jgi:hypothetical protein
MAKKGGRAEIDPQAEKRKLVEKWRKLLTTYVEFMLCAEQEDIAQDEAEIDRLMALMKASPKLRREVLEILDEVVNTTAVASTTNEPEMLTARISDFRYVAYELEIPDSEIIEYIEFSTRP